MIGTLATLRPSGRSLALTAALALCLTGTVRLAAGAVIPVKAIVAQILLERAFDRSVSTHQPQKPWPWADMVPVARVKVVRLGIDRIVLDTGSGQAMAFGPTVLPGGAAVGAAGTTVLAAHRDTHFRFLKDVRSGDVIALEGTNGVTLRYRVTGSEVVRWDRFSIIDEPSARELALATCYPFDAMGHGPLRYVVRARLIEKS